MNKLRYLIPALSLVFIVQCLRAQDTMIIVYSGYLTSDEIEISNQPCSINFTILNESGEEVLLNRIDHTTDAMGHLAFAITDIPDVFNSGSRTPSIKMILSIKPTEASERFNDQGTTVTYTLRKNGIAGYTTTRMDGLVMERTGEQQLWVFRDRFPARYLRSSFYISFSKELTDIQKIYNNGWKLEQQLHPEVSEQPLPDRGLKGGYAVGGFKKKN